MWTCPACGGSAVGIGVLRRVTDRAFADAVWVAATEHEAVGDRACPLCTNPMLLTDTQPFGLDVCRSCRFVWFDPREYELAPRPKGLPVQGEQLTQEQLEAVGRFHADRIAERWRYKPDAELGEQLAMVPGALGLPVEEEAPEIRRTPWVTWTIALSMTAALGWIGLDGVGIYHLLTNVYFLLVFGDNVEDFLGCGNYLLLLTVASLTGVGAHFFFVPEGDVLLMGAAAGVSGVVVFYGTRFPQARLRYFRLFGWISMPASAAAGLWVLTQVVGPQSPFVKEEVSSLALASGAAIGLWFWFMWRNE